MVYTDPDNEQELIEWERDLERQGPTDDYIREAYGDPCPVGHLRWGGDCVCLVEDDGPDLPVPPREATAIEPWESHMGGPQEDDIEF